MPDLYGNLRDIGFRSYYSGRAGDYFRSNKFKGIRVVAMWNGADFYRKTKVPGAAMFFGMPVKDVLLKPRETHLARIPTKEATKEKLLEIVQSGITAQRTEGIE